MRSFTGSQRGSGLRARAKLHCDASSYINDMIPLEERITGNEKGIGGERERKLV